MSYVDLKVNASGAFVCCRQGCKADAADGSGFCRPCLAYLSLETDEDPLGDRPPELVVVVP